MSLTSDYLVYEKRRGGMDHDLYDWSNALKRKPIRFPDGVKLALWITPVLEFFPLTPNAEGPRAPGHMVTPFPDLRTYTTKDYGNRVGIFRILKLLDDFEVTASVVMNAAIAERYPALLREITERRFEIIAHGGDMNDVLTDSMGEDAELSRITDTLDRFASAGVRCISGWLSPGRLQSARTPDLLARAGLEYHCDWVNDDLPYAMRTGSGAILAMPFSQDLEDRKLMVDLRQPEVRYIEQVLDAANLLLGEAEHCGGRILHLPLHPYVIGQPFRIAALKELLATLTARDAVCAMTGRQIAHFWKESQ